MRLQQGDETFYLGKWRGRVVEVVADENQQGRLKAVCPEVYGDVVSPWAMPCFPGGEFKMPEVGDQIYLEFEQGKPANPIWVGYAPSASDGAKPAAETLIGKDDDTTALGFGKGGGLLSIDGDDGPVDLLEPATTSQPSYPNVKGIRVGANYIEIDGTQGEERVQMYHRSGSYIEIGKTGQVAHKAQGRRTIWTRGSVINAATGSMTVKAGGKRHVESQGERRIIRGISYTKVEGDANRDVNGNIEENLVGAVTTIISGVYKSESGGVVSNSLNDRVEMTMGKKSVLIAGAVNETIGGKDFPLGQIISKQCTVALGSYAITLADPAGGDFLLTTLAGGVIITAATAVSLNSAGPISLISATSYSLVAPNIQLGITPAIHPVPWGDVLITTLQQILTFLQTHQHIGNLGAPTAPNPTDVAAIQTFAATVTPLTHTSPIVFVA